MDGYAMNGMAAGPQATAVLHFLRTFFPQILVTLLKHPRLSRLLPIILAASMGASMFKATLVGLKSSLQSALVGWMTSSVTTHQDDELSVAFFAHYCSMTRWLPSWDFSGQSLDYVKHRSNAAAVRNSFTLPGKAKTICYFPNRPSQLFFYKRRLFYCEASKDSYEDYSFTVRCLGWSARPIQEMLEEVLQSYLSAKRRNLVRLNYPASDARLWSQYPLDVPARPLNSLSMDREDRLNLLADMERFLKGEQWYKDRHVPWRRGYLFYGPPGAGKSSAVLALASHFAIPVYVLQFGGAMDDESLPKIVKKVGGQNSIVLLEDVDNSLAGVRKGSGSKSDGGQTSAVTLSGLLNALDGLWAPQGVMYIMTTNHKDRLDPALTRPGRVDYRLKFDLASQEQARSMFLHLYGLEQMPSEELQELASSFAARVPPKKVSPAALQDFLLRHRDSPSDAAAAVSEWAKETMATNDQDDQGCTPGTSENPAPGEAATTSDAAEDTTGPTDSKDDATSAGSTGATGSEKSASVETVDSEIDIVH